MNREIDSYIGIGKFPWALLISVLLYIIVILYIKDISFAKGNGQTLAGHATMFLFLILLSFLCRRFATVSLLLEATAYLVAAWPLLRIFNHLIMINDVPLADATLASWDALFGFDWLSYAHFIDRQPILLTAFRLTYWGLSAYTSAFFILIFAFNLSNRAVVNEFITLFAVTAMACSIIGSFFPAEAAAIYYAPDLSEFRTFNPTGGSYHIEHLRALRSGLPIIIDTNSLPGLTTFPSFHTAMGMVCMYCTRHNSVIFPTSILVNLIMIFSTPVAGAHYLIDVIAGALVALVAIGWHRGVAARMQHPKMPLQRAKATPLM